MTHPYKFEDRWCTLLKKKRKQEFEQRLCNSKFGFKSRDQNAHQPAKRKRKRNPHQTATRTAAAPSSPTLTSPHGGRAEAGQAAGGNGGGALHSRRPRLPRPSRAGGSRLPNPLPRLADSPLRANPRPVLVSGFRLRFR